MDMEFLILNKDRSQGAAMWWRPDRAGYTTDVDSAGRYSSEESARIVRSGSGKDIRVPVSAIGRTVTTRRIVDVGDADNHAELMAFDGV